MRTLKLNSWNPESTLPPLGSMQGGTASKGLFLHLLPGCMRLQSKLEGWAFAYRDKALFLIGVQLLYNVVLVSAVQQGESAVSIHTLLPFKPPSPRSLTPLSHTSRCPQSTRLSSLCYAARGACVRRHSLPTRPTSPSPPVCTDPFSTSGSPFLPWI